MTAQSQDIAMTRTEQLRQWVRAHPLAAFFVLAYGLSWFAWTGAYLGLGMVGVAVGGFGPALAAWIVTRQSGASVRAWARQIIHWRVKPRFYLYAFGLPALLWAAMNGALMMLGKQVDLSLLGERLPSYLGTVVFVSLVGGGFEEPGWRGFALPRLQDRHKTPVRATLVLALLWGLWHLPLYGLGFVGPMFYAFFYTHLYNKTRSVLLCIVLHGSFTAALDNLILTADSLTVDLVILGTLAAGTLVLIVATRGRLGYLDSTDPTKTRKRRRSNGPTPGLAATAGSLAARTSDPCKNASESRRGVMSVQTQPKPTGASELPVAGEASEASIDLYWLPLGAGGWFVRLNGRIYEAIRARLERRRPLDLYHSALEVRLPEGRFVIENSWPIPDADGASRGVVFEGAVGSRRFARFRALRYEVRRWRDGTIPDADEAVASPQRLSDDPRRARRLLDLVGSVPRLVWGRDETGTGDMWNSNSVISWLVARSDLSTDMLSPPASGRAPGWKAGLVTARRQLDGGADDPRWTSPKGWSPEAAPRGAPAR